jgi:hypothetical protein
VSNEFIDEDEIEVVESSPAETRLAELGIRLDPAIAYRMDTMFPRLEGWGSKGELQRKAKVIRLVEPKLTQILRDGEEVLYVAKGVQMAMFETVFMGMLVSALLNQTVFVLTNARIIVIRTDSTGKPKHTCWMLYYSEVQKFKKTWTGSLALTLKDRRKLTFAGFTKTDGKAMPTIFEEALETYRRHGFQPQTSQSQENLCTRCFECVPKGEYVCNNCGQQFWKPIEVARRSLIFPSWGDFLLGHTGLACFELIGYFFSLSALLAVSIAAVLRGRPMETILVAVVPLAVMHAFDAFITYFVASKGLHPK